LRRTLASLQHRIRISWQCFGALNTQMTAYGEIRIGISGWRYEPWRGVFYPEKLAQRLELQYASSKFNSIELNGSFYSLQRPKNFQQWYSETPEDFVFSVKAPRFITHIRRLKDVEIPVANFLASGVLRLEDKLGPILWQFPPTMKFEATLFEHFFRLLPHSHREAAEIGKDHDKWLDGRAWLDVQKERPLRHAVEIRNKSFACEEYISLLRKYRIGSVVADTPEWPRLMDLTADFVYCRLHGSEKLYVSGYSDQAISEWADRILRWAQGKEVEDGDRASATNGDPAHTRDVFAYFDNDAKVKSPANALQLREHIEQLNGIGEGQLRDEDRR
jgi:uncharacterized protein YecE (DUF72 family)